MIVKQYHMRGSCAVLNIKVVEMHSKHKALQAKFWKYQWKLSASEQQFYKQYGIYKLKVTTDYAFFCLFNLKFEPELDRCKQFVTIVNDSLCN